MSLAGNEYGRPARASHIPYFAGEISLFSGESSGAGHRLRRDEHHRVRLVEAGVRVSRPVLPVEVDPQGTVPLVAEGRVVAERPRLRVDVEHVAAVVAVVAGPGHEVLAE